ncbi:hypothetical protein ACIA8J_33660 [Streptomyces asoensis]|uniref:hypothetical protein n=1 Tax=Streptomyces asoensis TaxID=249586 RepID=UPI0037B50A6A
MNQEALPNEVIDAARKLRNEGARPLTRAEGLAIAQKLRAGAMSANKGLTEYLVDFVHEELGPLVTTPDPDVKSAFWSHVVENHPHLEENETLSNEYIAGAYTAAQPEGSTRFLEGTRGGKELVALRLWDKAVQDGLRLDEEEGKALASAAWSALSQEYAIATQSEAAFFAGGLAPWSVAYQTELPELRTGTGLDNIHFMYPVPERDLEGLLPETQALLSEDRVRAQVHHMRYEDPDAKRARTAEAGYVDLTMLRSLTTPEAQRAAVLDACARVAQLDGRTADVERLTSEVLSLRTEQAREIPAAEVEVEREAPPAEEQQQPKASAPAVSTHGQYLPGVTVNARTGPAPLESLTLPTPEKAAASAHAFLPGVVPQVKPIAAPAVNSTPTAAPPAPEQSRDAGMGV